MCKHILPRILAVLMLLLSSLVSCTRPDSETVIPPDNRQQVFQLQGRIQQGPSAGLNLSGDLRTTIDSAGRLQGTLIRESGSPVTVTGQIAGQAIHLSFDLSNHNAVLVVGTLQHGIDNPQGTAGGLLTGPQPGDSGDWFARWTTIVTPITPVPDEPDSDSDSLSVTNIVIMGALILVAAILLVTLFQPKVGGKSLYARTRGRSTIPFVKASAQTLEPERWPDEATLPLAQFATTYAYGDDHYDLSFTIESARGEFLGECGVGISATISGSQLGTDLKVEPEVSQELPSADDALVFLAKLAAGKEDRLSTQAKHESETRLAESKGRQPPKANATISSKSVASRSDTSKHKAVTALEVWSFDKNDINTVTKVLCAVQGFYNPAARSSRDRVHDVLTIEPDQIVVLETKTLRLRVKVIAVEYLVDVTSSASVFKQVSLKLAVWVK